MVNMYFRNSRGERSGTSKLKEHEAQAILDATPPDRKDAALARQLADKHGVRPATICKIWQRKSWFHLKRKTVETAEVHQ